MKTVCHLQDCVCVCVCIRELTGLLRCGCAEGAGEGRREARLAPGDPPLQPAAAARTEGSPARENTEG